MKAELRKKRQPPRASQLCSCGHAKDRHTGGAGCLGDDGPGANCSCDEFEAKP